MFLDFIGRPLDAVKHKLDIRGSSDVDGTIQNIDENIEVKGYNIWILVCAAVLASIGLDTNSTAVIIGAMLISPLMSPILGVGLGLGINDQPMFFHALRNLGIATIASLGTSALYFLFTPFGNITPEISGRTYPTLLDVGVALFGGIAGIVSGSRKEKTNAIPGVAIATALMPPLCSAGFGLAKLQAWVFFGAFYLFFINAVFISLSTYLIVRYLRFPKKQEYEKEKQRRVNRWMGIFLIIVIIPSVIFLVNVWRETETKNEINRLLGLVTKDLGNDGEHEILKTDVRNIPNTDSSIIRVSMAGTNISSDTLQLYNKKLQENGYGKYKLRITTIDREQKEQIDKLNTQIDNLSDLRDEVATVKATQIKLVKTQDKIDIEKKRLEAEQKLTQEMYADLVIFFPQIEKIKIERERNQQDGQREEGQVEIGNIKVVDSTQVSQNTGKIKFRGLEPYLSFTTENEVTKRSKKQRQKKMIIVWQGLNPSLKMNPNFIPDSAKVDKKDKHKEKDKKRDPNLVPKIKKQLTKVILTWEEDIDPNELTEEEIEKLESFLKRKLILKDDKDSLEINHLVIAKVYNFDASLDSLNLNQVKKLQLAILRSGNEKAVKLIRDAGGADGVMGNTTREAFAILNKPLEELIE